MKPLIFYLNELSCAFEKLPLNAIRPHLENAIMALQSASRIRQDVFLRLNRPFSQITLGDKDFPLAAVLPGPNSRMSVLKRFIDKAPFPPVYELKEEIHYGGVVASAMSWAYSDKSLVLSFGYKSPWSEHAIQAELQVLDGSGDLTIASEEIRNVSIKAHIVTWQSVIESYGKDIAHSSLIYRGNQFVIKMYVLDHNPPHVHICRANSTDIMLARVRIDTGDILDGDLSSTVLKEVRKIIADNRQAIVDGWERCMKGQFPLSLIETPEVVTSE